MRGVTASTGTFGRWAETSRAVRPLLVGTTIAASPSVYVDPTAARATEAATSVPSWAPPAAGGRGGRADGAAAAAGGARAAVGRRPRGGARAVWAPAGGRRGVLHPARALRRTRAGAGASDGRGGRGAGGPGRQA